MTYCVECGGEQNYHHPKCSIWERMNPKYSVEELDKIAEGMPTDGWDRLELQTFLAKIKKNPDKVKQILEVD